MSPPNQLTRRRAEAFLRTISGETILNATTAQETALQAHSMALEVNSRLLEAEALLQLGRTFSPTLSPGSTLEFLQRAERIFVANGLQIKAMSCRVAAARALHDLGQERNAIALATTALSEKSLSVQDQVGAYLIMALSHGNLGEFDESVNLLSISAAPLTEKSGGEILRPHVIRALAITHTRILVSRNFKSLWQGLLESSTNLIPSPDPYYVLSLLDEASAALPEGSNWTYIDVARQFVLGLTAASALSTIEELRGIADRCEEIDPPLACWSLYCQALVMRKSNEPNLALGSLTRAYLMSERWGLKQIARDIVLQFALVKESLGDYSGSLQHYKSFSAMRMQSVMFTLAEKPHGDFLTAKRTSTGLTNVTGGSYELRNLEPRHVKQAIRFIDEMLHEPISVKDVVENVEVGRRTLELAFKESKSCTVAQYIKRCKLEKAATSLITTNVSVQQVARSVGYKWPAAFSRDFLAHFGTKPSLWRVSNAAAP